MKKLITLILALAGVVGTVSASKLYVKIDQIEGWWFNDNAKFDMYSWSNTTGANSGWDDHTHIINPTFMYGDRWYVYNMPSGHDRAIVRRYAYKDDKWFVANQTNTITVTSDVYISLKSGSGNLEWDILSEPAWTGLCVRSSVDGEEGYSNNMVCSNNYNTFTKTYTKGQFGNASTFEFRLKHVENIRFDEDGTWQNTWTQIGPLSDNTAFELPSSLTTVNQFNDETKNNWQITLPDYDYDNIVITAKYVNESGYKWKISADAYISKTANGSNAGTNLGYSTFGAETDVDLSNLPSGVTAQTATVNASGIITYNDATELAAGEGVLLTNTTGADQILSIPVKASANEVSNNALRRVAATTLDQTDGSYVHYILTKNTVANNNAELGWYKVNAIGSNNLTVGTAYLRVNTSTPDPSRGFFPLWSDEPTAVNAINTNQALDGQTYNMAGQRVVHVTKGLYIINGKKVVK